MLLDFTHVLGQSFPIGQTRVTYIYADDSYNVAYCNFSVEIEEGKLEWRMEYLRGHNWVTLGDFTVKTRKFCQLWAVNACLWKIRKRQVA